MDDRQYKTYHTHIHGLHDWMLRSTQTLHLTFTSHFCIATTIQQVVLDLQPLSLHHTTDI
jgi:hypothetical protein